MSNFQPQPAWISASTAETTTRVEAFIRSVYAWMFGGLLLTAFASLWVASSEAMQQIVWNNRGLLLVVIIAEIGLVLGLRFGLQRLSPAAAASMFLIYSLLNGLTLSWILFVYTHSSVVQAFVIAGGMFGAMSVYGMVTKRDISSWGSFLFMGVIGIILCLVATRFIHSTGFEMAFNIAGVFIFVGLTAWDTQRLKSFATVDGPMQQKLAIFGALRLYLDFVNLFLFLLRILGDRRR